MKRALLLVLCACGEPSAPPPSSTPPPPVVSDGAQPPAVSITCAPAALAPTTAVELAGSTGSGGIGLSPRGRNRGMGQEGYLGRDLRRFEAPRVQLGAVTTRGALAAPVVVRTLRRSRAQLDACYRRALATKPGFAGTQSVEIAIDARGKITAKVSGDADTSACMQKALENMPFPKPSQGDATATLAWQLLPGNGVGSQPPPAPPAEPTAWTPFAAGPAIASADIANPVARDAQTALGSALGELDACFVGKPGRARAMLSHPGGTASASVRVGGVGDPAIESCLAKVVGARAFAGAVERVELACDVQRGDGVDVPWRVIREGYDVIEVARDTFTHAGKTYSADVSPVGGTLSDPSKTVLVLAEPDATGPTLSRALQAGGGGAASLVAIVASGGAPVFVGMGPDSRRLGADAGPRVELEVRAGSLRSCIGGKPRFLEVSLLEPAKVDSVVADIATECSQHACARTVVVAVEDGLVAKDLVAVASGLWRADRQVFTIGGTACRR